MASCPFKVRKRDTQELGPCGDKANYVITIEGKPPFRCCAIHRGKYKKDGVKIAYQPVKAGVADNVPHCDNPPPPPVSVTDDNPTTATTTSSVPVSLAVTSSTPPSIGLHLAPPPSNTVVRSAPKKMTPKTSVPRPSPGSAKSLQQLVKMSNTPPPQPGILPAGVMVNDRAEVIDKILHPVYSEMFATACNMRIRQKASAKYSSEDMEKVLALGSLKEDEVEKATKQGKAAKKAIAGEKALQELNGGVSSSSSSSRPQPTTSSSKLLTPARSSPPPPPQQQALVFQQQPMMQPQMMGMGVMPQMVVPTHFAPIPSNAFIDAPAPPIPVGIGGMQQQADGEPIPQMMGAPQPDGQQMQAQPGGMVPDANGVLRFQSGTSSSGGAGGVGMQVGEDTQPQQPQKLSGNALTMTMRQNRNGILGFFALIEHVAGAFGFPGAVGTAKRLSKDPAFEQCLSELLEPEPDSDGKERSPLDILKIDEDEHPILKTLKLYGGHLANNALNYGTGKASMALSKDVMANAQADFDSVTAKPDEKKPSDGEEKDASLTPGIPDSQNEMLPRDPMSPDQQQPAQMALPPQYTPQMPPMVLPNAHGQMFVMPFTPSSYSVTPVGVVPVEPLYKKTDAPAQQQQQQPPSNTAADSSNLLETD